MSDDDLITLAEACERVFAGKIKPSTLRAEVGRGKLTIFRVGRRDFTTVRHIRQMVEQRCRVEKQPQGSTSIPSEEPGQSETERITSAQDALSQTLKALKTRSGPTLAPSTSRGAARRH